MVSNSKELRKELSQYPDALTAEETAQLLRINVKTVYKLIREGSLPSVKVGRSFRISKTELVRYIDGNYQCSNPKYVVSENSADPVWTSHKSCDIVPVAKKQQQTERSAFRCRINQILQQAYKQKKEDFTP